MNKYLEYENIPLQIYAEYNGLTNEDIIRFGINLYHGIRFDSINRLESIFQNGNILCGNKINLSFKSYDGSTKYLYINSNSYENCNMGKYVSVMPYENSMEFNVFIRENIFLVIKGTINALKPIYLSYNDYSDLINSGLKYNNLYSYASSEYLVKDEISLDDVLFIGIDSRYYNGDYNKIVNDVIKLMKVYEISIPFIDIQNNNELYSFNKGKKINIRM